MMFDDFIKFVKELYNDDKLIPLHSPKFIGNENEINLNTEHPEFIQWKWIEIDMLPKVIVKFKKNLYLDLLKEIKLVIS